MSSRQLHVSHCISLLLSFPLHKISLCVGLQIPGIRDEALFFSFLSHFRCLSVSSVDGEPTATGSISQPIPIAAYSTNHLSEIFQISSQFFILKSAAMLFPINRKMGDATANTLFRISHTDHLVIDLLRSTLRHANDCKHLVCPSEGKALIEIGFQKCTSRKHVECLTGLTVRYKPSDIKVTQEHVHRLKPTP